jgi:serine/threonine protein kinase
MALAPGTRIAQYVVEAPIGRGGMATVYRARHAELGTPFALKLLDHRSPEVRDRLLAEGRMQARLQHPNVVSVVDVVVHEGCPGLVMEYVDGPSLQQLVDARTRLPIEARDALVTGILHGVRAAHNAGFVHRDLKPGNILLARTDDRLIPKVADFGLARATDDDDGARRTRTGMVFGTPVYMAPEQTRNAKDADQRSDVFALGVILYELVTGRVPVDTDDLITLFTKLSTRDYPSPRRWAPDLPEHQEAAILAALEPDRERRIPDCGTLLAAWRGTVTFDGEPVEVDRTHPFDSAFMATLGALTHRPASAPDTDGATVSLPAIEPRRSWSAQLLAGVAAVVGGSALVIASGAAVVVLAAGAAAWWATLPAEAPPEPEPVVSVTSGGIPLPQRPPPPHSSETDAATAARAAGVATAARAAPAPAAGRAPRRRPPRPRSPSPGTTGR